MGKVTRLDRGRIQFQKTRKDSPVVYTINEVIEFGNNGYVYEVLSLKGERMYYKRLASGETDLFEGRKQYVIRKDSKLTPMTSKNFRTILQQEIECVGRDRLLSKLQYSDVALRNFIESANQGLCDSDKIVYSKAGMYAGYGDFKFQAGSLTFPELSSNASAMIVALFGDLPLYKPKSLLLSAEVLWMRALPDFYDESGNETRYLGLEVNSLSLPIGVKWVLSDSHVKVYLKTQTFLSHLRVESPSGVIKTESNGSTVEIYAEELPASSGYSFGLLAGVGVEIPFINRKNFHAEMKYISSLPYELDSIDIGFSGFSFIVGFSF